jgi:hypothetical protein
VKGEPEHRDIHRVMDHVFPPAHLCRVAMDGVPEVDGHFHSWWSLSNSCDSQILLLSVLHCNNFCEVKINTLCSEAAGNHQPVVTLASMPWMPKTLDSSNSRASFTLPTEPPLLWNLLTTLGRKGNLRNYDKECEPCQNGRRYRRVADRYGTILWHCKLDGAFELLNSYSQKSDSSTNG